MLGKNNRLEQKKQMTEKQSYFSLRKTKVGLMSCLIGLACIYQTSDVVFAEELQSEPAVDKQAQDLATKDDGAEQTDSPLQEDSSNISDKALNLAETKTNTEAHSEGKEVEDNEVAPSLGNATDKGESNRQKEDESAENTDQAASEEAASTQQSDELNSKLRSANAEIAVEDQGLGAINSYKQTDNVIQLDYETGEKSSISL